MSQYDDGETRRAKVIGVDPVTIQGIEKVDVRVATEGGEEFWLLGREPTRPVNVGDEGAIRFDRSYGAQGRWRFLPSGASK